MESPWHSTLQRKRRELEGLTFAQQNRRPRAPAPTPISPLRAAIARRDDIVRNNKKRTMAEAGLSTLGTQPKQGIKYSLDVTEDFERLSMARAPSQRSEPISPLFAFTIITDERLDEHKARVRERMRQHLAAEEWNRKQSAKVK